MIGVILTGGASTRMGRSKADYELDGRAMADWVVDALTICCDAVVAAGRAWRELPVIPDVPDMEGPLAGIVASLRHVKGPITVVAVDQPWVRADTLQRLAASSSGDRIVVPMDGGVAQVTCAVYTPDLLEGAVQRSIQAALDVVSHDAVARDTWTQWGEDGRSWFSVDRPADAAVGLERFGRLR